VPARDLERGAHVISVFGEQGGRRDTTLTARVQAIPVLKLSGLDHPVAAEALPP
jgi:hypothetical protein